MLNYRTMGPAILQFTLTTSVLILAGTLLTKCADRLADETGLGRIFVGSILLAGSTSLPELMVDFNAIWQNQPDMAVGDLFGSSIFNLFILAVLDTALRQPRGAFTNEFAHHAQSAVLSINLVALAGIGILSPIRLSFGGVGLFIWIMTAVYLVGLKTTFAGSKEQGRFTPQKITLASVSGFLVSAILILITAPFLIEAADRIATATGLGHTFVGTTLIALCTSLPEIVSTIAAFRMGHPDLALGNIFGSNIFNMVLFFPLDALYPASLFASIQPIHALTAFCVIAVSSVAALGLTSRKRQKSYFWEPSSGLIIMLVLAFL